MTTSAESANIPSDLLDISAAAAHLGLTVSTMYTYRRDGRLPPADVMVGQSPAWTPDTLDRWSAQRPGAQR